MMDMTQRKTKSVILSILLAVVLTVGCIAVSTPMNVHAAEDDDTNWSFDSIATTIQEYFNDKSGISKNSEGLVGLDNLQAGNAGSFVGYATKGFFSSNATSASQEHSYTSYADLSTGSSSKTSAVLDYCRYGYMLSQLGLDSVASTGSFPFRKIIGGITWAVYVLSLGLNAFLSVIIGILKRINPFNWLITSVNNVILANSTAKLNGGVGDLTITNAVSSTFASWMQSFWDLSWMVMIPACIASIAVTGLLLKQTSKMKSQIRKLLIRIVFLGIGLPVCISTYTRALDSMGEYLSENHVSSQIIASTFVDFESWAERGRLAPPDGSYFEVQKTAENDVNGAYEPTPLSVLNARASCYYINSQYSYGVNSGLPEQAPFYILDPKGSSNAVATWNTNSFADTDDDNSRVISNTLNIISRYTTGQQYSSSAYESSVKGVLQSLDADSKETAASVFTDAQKASNFAGTTNASKFLNAGNYNIFGNGGLQCIERSDGFLKYQFTNSDTVMSNTMNKNNFNYPQGLSTLSMYNYLNSRFDDTKVLVYSPSLVTSGHAGQFHMSVNLVGNGLQSVLYWLNCIILMGAFTFIGYFYGFGILFAGLKRMFRVLTSVPFAMLGSVRAMAKVVTYAVILIFEVVVTFALYQIVCEVLMDISGIIEAPFGHALASSNSAWANASGTVAMPLMLVLSCIVYIIFIIVAIRIRKTVVKSVDEAAADLIDKFFGVSSEPDALPSGNNMLATAGGSLASGAGMALGSNMMKNQGSTSQGGVNPKSVSGGKGSGNGVSGGTTSGAKGESGMNGAMGGSGASGALQLGKNDSLGITNNAMTTGSTSNILGGNGGITNSVTNDTDSDNGVDNQNVDANDVANIANASGPEIAGDMGDVTNLNAGDVATAGAGIVAEAASDKLFEDNNKEMEGKSLGETMQDIAGDNPMVSAHPIENVANQTNETLNQAEERTIAAFNENQTRATDEDARKNQAAEAKARIVRDAVTDGAKQKVAGTAQQAVGVGEAVIGAKTGDVGLVSHGAKDLVNGTAASGRANSEMRQKLRTVSSVSRAEAQQTNQTAQAQSKNSLHVSAKKLKPKQDNNDKIDRYDNLFQ